jgi:hypothetical protein
MQIIPGHDRVVMRVEMTRVVQQNVDAGMERLIRIHEKRVMEKVKHNVLQEIRAYRVRVSDRPTMVCVVQ